MIVKQPKKLGIKHYSFEREVGGVIIGKWVTEKTNKWKLKTYLQLENRNPNPETDYQLPKLEFIPRLKILWYVMIGYSVLGLWHTHVKGKLVPSKKDIEAVLKVAKGRRFILGIGGQTIELNNHGVEEKEFKIKNYIFNAK